MNTRRRIAPLLPFLAAAAHAPAVLADDEPAKQAQNPIAALISLPFQLNYDDKMPARPSGATSG